MGSSDETADIAIDRLRLQWIKILALGDDQ
jgi:hypothetical protein